MYPLKRNPLNCITSLGLPIYLLMLTIAFIPIIICKCVTYYTEFPKMMLLFTLTPLMMFRLQYTPIDQQQPIGYLGRFINLFLIWLFLNCMFSLEPLLSFFGFYGTFDGFFFYLFSICFFFLGNQFKEQKFVILIPLLISASIISTFSIIEFWNGASRVASTLGHPINLANFLILVIAGLVGLIFCDEIKFKFKWYFYLLTLFLLTAAQILTFSRSGWYGQIFIYLLMAFCLGKKTLLKRWKRVAAILAITLLSILFAYLLIYFQPNHSLSESTRLSEMTQLSGSRILMLKTAWKVFLQFPIGAGLSTFNFTATKFLPAQGVDRTIWTNAHNDFFNTLASQGIIGGLFYIVLIILLIRMWWKWRRIPERDGLSAGLWAGVFGHLLMIQSSFPGCGYTYLFWFYIGLLNISSITSLEEFPISQSWKKIFWGIIFICSVVFSLLYFSADVKYLQAQKNFDNKKHEQVSNLFNDANRLIPWIEQYKELQLQYDSKLLNSNFSGNKNTQFKRVIQEMKVINKLNPLNHRYKAAIGSALIEIANYKDAIVFYKQALDLFPNNFDYYNLIGFCYIRLGQNNDARLYLQKTLELDPKNDYARKGLNWLNSHR